MRPFLALALWACAAAPQAASPSPQAATPEDAKAFIAKVNKDLKRLSVESSTADWIKNTYITDDTERNAAAANERLLAYATEAVKGARPFKETQIDFDTGRMLHLLRIQSPVIDDPQKRLEVTTLAARLEGYYGAAKDKKGRTGEFKPFEVNDSQLTIVE